MGRLQIVTSRKGEIKMTVKEMNRYMRLVNRLMWIMDHSGVSWQPEYAEEAEQIRKELKDLRPIIEEARRAKGGEKPCTEESCGNTGSRKTSAC